MRRLPPDLRRAGSPTASPAPFDHKPLKAGRFNHRLGDYLGCVPQNRAAHHRRFRDHAERDAYLQPLPPITIVPACDASIIRLPPNSSLNSRDRTPAPG